MARQEIKEYVIGRLTTLLKEYKEQTSGSDPDIFIRCQINEVARMAAQFGIKTRHVFKDSEVGQQFPEYNR